MHGKKTPLLACLVTLALFFGVTREVGAVPVTLDFEELRHDDDLITNSDSYNRNGFTLSPTHNNPGPASFNIVGTLHPNFLGSTTLFNGTGGGTNTLTRTDGGPFDLFSIDLGENPGFAQLPSGEIIPVSVGPYDLSFIGTRQDASTVNNTFTITNFLTLETFTFSRFTDLVSVDWSGQSTQFDNIVVEPIPEPSTLLLLGSGLAGLGFFRRLRKVA